jgi:hypothetical protein
VGKGMVDPMPPSYSSVPNSSVPYLAGERLIPQAPRRFFVRHGLFGCGVRPAWVNGQLENLVRIGLPERVGRRRGFLARVKEGLSEPVRPR